MVHTEQDHLGAQERHADLIAKLEGAKKGSDELSAHVMCVFAPAGSYVEQSRFNSAWCVYEPGLNGPRLWERRGWPHRAEGWNVTTSIDAAVALIERVLPDLPRLEMWRGTDGEWGVNLPGQDTAYAATPALALCIALLKALGEEGGG